MASTGERRSQVPLIAMTVVALAAIAALVWALVGRPAETAEPTIAPSRVIDS